MWMKLTRGYHDAFEAVDEQTFAITIILWQFHFTQANCRDVMRLHHSSKTAWLVNILTKLFLFNNEHFSILATKIGHTTVNKISLYIKNSQA